MDLVTYEFSPLSLVFEIIFSKGSSAISRAKGERTGENIRKIPAVARFIRSFREGCLLDSEKTMGINEG